MSAEELCLLAAATAELRDAVECLGLGEDAFEALAGFRHAISFPVGIERADGSRLGLTGYHAQHRTGRGQARGGVRFSPTLDLDDARAFARWMSWTCALVDIPYDGSGGGVRVDPDLFDPGELEQIARSWAAGLAGTVLPGHDVLDPDLGTDSQVLSWIRGSDSVWPSRRIDAVAVGVATLAQAALAGSGRPSTGIRSAVQGFGDIGSRVARQLSDAGVRVVAVSDVHAALHAPEGLDVRALTGHLERTGSIAGFPAATSITAAELLGLEVELLVPCAVENMITVAQVDGIGAEVLVEAARRPVTRAAEQRLRERGVLVVPDILATAGGPVDGYFEAMQSNQGRRWSRGEHRTRLVQRVTAAWTATSADAARSGRGLRAAATERAVARLIGGRGPAPGDIGH